MWQTEKTRLITTRLTPGQDVRLELDALAKRENLKAAAVVAAVGSLRQVSLRFAEQKEATIFKGPYEIVSLSGHLGVSGLHLHLAVADAKGQVKGGHLMEGNLVRTTLELTIIENEDLEFLRVEDPATGYKELQVQKRLR